MTDKHKSNIKVAVRCRPPLEREINAGGKFEKLMLSSE